MVRLSHMTVRPDIGVAREAKGPWPLKRKFGGGGGWPPIPYQYIELVEQLNYCLVFWISATFVSTTKVFLVRYNDPKRCYLVVRTDSIVKSRKTSGHATILSSPKN